MFTYKEVKCQLSKMRIFIGLLMSPVPRTFWWHVRCLTNLHLENDVHSMSVPWHTGHTHRHISCVITSAHHCLAQQLRRKLQISIFSIRLMLAVAADSHLEHLPSQSGQNRTKPWYRQMLIQAHEKHQVNRELWLPIPPSKPLLLPTPQSHSPGIRTPVLFPTTGLRSHH